MRDRKVEELRPKPAVSVESDAAVKPWKNFGEMRRLLEQPGCVTLKWDVGCAVPPRVFAIRVRAWRSVWVARFRRARRSGLGSCAH